MTPKPGTVYYPPELRALWPQPLAADWARQYPQLFDGDDVRLATTQPRNHFCEWFVAMHLYHREGALSLLEKYAYGNHARKVAKFETLLSKEQQAFLRGFRASFGVQRPGLLVYVPGTARCWFAEAKGPGDRLSELQRKSHLALTRKFGVPVEVFYVRPGKRGA